jgi:uncharacterized membrane protein YhfC
MVNKKNTNNINPSENKTTLNPSQINTIIGMVLSLIVVVGNYFWWIKDLFDLFNAGIGVRIFYFVFVFFVGLGFATLLLNFNTAMTNLANKKIN